MTYFKEEWPGEGEMKFLFLLFSLIPSAENNRYAKVLYFGVVCPEPHHSSNALSYDPSGWKEWTHDCFSLPSDPFLTVILSVRPSLTTLLKF